MKSLQRIHSYQFQGEALHWVIKIALNTTRDYFRSKAFRQSQQQLEYKEELSPASSTDVPFMFERKESYAEVKEAIAQLPEYQREAILLRYYKGWKIKEIAVAMETTESTVKSRLHQGIQKLKKKWERGERQHGTQS